MKLTNNPQELQRITLDKIFTDREIYFSQFEYEHYINNKFTCWSCFKQWLRYRIVDLVYKHKLGCK